MRHGGKNWKAISREVAGFVYIYIYIYIFFFFFFFFFTKLKLKKQIIKLNKTKIKGRSA